MSRSIWSIFERTSASASGAWVVTGVVLGAAAALALGAAAALADPLFFGDFLLGLLAIGIP